jgi:MSHA pilin protein MshC
MQRRERGFTLIELITVIILLGIISVTLVSRLGSVSTANLQASRDDVIAALFFAQQTAMARRNIQLVLTANTVSVTENASPIVVHSDGYPLKFPDGVTTTARTLSYDRLGGIINGPAPVIITLSAKGASASITVEATGYAH